MTSKAKIADIQGLLLGEAHTPHERKDPLFDRLARAVQGIGRADTVGPSDIAALVRQAMVRNWTANHAPVLVVPATAGWPGPRVWSEFGCSCTPHENGRFSVVPRRWTPDWLDEKDVHSVDAACREERRRTVNPVPADPLVAMLVPSINEMYASAGQQEAVRAAFIAPLGSTVVVCLPTGAGKTLAFQTAALRGIDRKQLVVVIVPTIALARDQERRFQDLLREREETRALASRSFAYHSGLTTEDRRALFEGIKDGSVPLVFTSPEAALGALRRPLLVAARAGRLTLFAVDEAHMVSQWGDSFRPEFQLVVGLRDELLRQATQAGHQAFPTMLLTATLTEESEVTLRQAFARDELLAVAEPRLRVESAVLVAEAPDEEERERRVLEALCYLPRPLLLYTTLREDAPRWGDLLRARGHRRIATVRGGDMATPRGERVLGAWTHREIDIIVATSAFGLGVDQSDVRAVVHACRPESLDRYYQEVGRSGRDGAASVALLLPVPGDVEVAESLATNPSISIDRGRERWEKMFFGRRKEPPPPPGTIVVPLTAVPKRITHSSELNVAWNQRTLVLMARSGLLRFASVPPPECVQFLGEQAEVFEARRRDAFEQDALLAAVQIDHAAHLQETTWRELVEPSRRWMAEQDRRTVEQMSDLVARRKTANELFRSIYTVEALGIEPPAPGHEPGVVFLERTRCHVGPALAAIFEGSGVRGRLYIHYEVPAEFLARRRWQSDVAQRTLERLAREGVVEFSFPPDFAGQRVWEALADHSAVRFACRVDETGSCETRARPRVTVLGRGSPAEQVRAVLEVERDHHVILFTPNAPDPFNPPRRLRDTVATSSLEALAGRLTQ
jgi:ATP-dependent DNA helicase RecQ